jgi:phosphate transport system permease protein
MSKHSVTTLDSLRRWRYAKDRIARYGVAIGGIGVIAALVLIFVYLVYIVLPMFQPARIEPVSAYALPGGASPSLYLSVEEQSEIGMRITADGRVVFFRVADGSVVQEQALPLETVRKLSVPQQPVTVPAGQVTLADGTVVERPARSLQRPPREIEETVRREVLRVTEVDPVRDVLALGLSDGSVLILRHEYEITYPGNRKTITPVLSYPYGETALPFAEGTLTDLAVRDEGDTLAFAGITQSGELLFQTFAKATSLIDETATLEPQPLQRLDSPFPAARVLLNPLLEWLYAVSAEGDLAYFDIRGNDVPRQIQRVHVTPPGTQLQQAAFLAGGYSLVIAASDGTISQWFPVRDEDNNYQLRHVRDFKNIAGEITVLVSESRRRGFLSGDAQGRLGLYYATSNRTLLNESVADGPLTQLAIAPRANLTLAETAAGKLQAWHVHNEYPEVSWSALWGKVWYEGYPEPARTWQSTAATNDFEPKLSLAPLTFGSIKGAFYAMLFAMPLAIMGAVYTAFFMAPRMRGMVKPTIEVMQALPTVVLGFLAGLWLAPMVEAHLPGVFGLLLLLPIFMLLFGYLWSRLPNLFRRRVPDGWEGALLVPVLIFFGWLTFQAGGPLEVWLFGGNLPLWMDETLGISYDQRNSLVVGFAMGFAVIPTIFSISEDAIFGVPKHLVNGSLALGATPWQTMVGVILPTASPGIFSAVMIGLGRAVGETMIVLMATGNTPIMDFSIFSGMRTLSANVAVEMPESEVGSTHYRILFLAALVLFMLTFALNTLAEMVRQRLRERYSNI